jgi:hypothetical protein
MALHLHFILPMEILPAFFYISKVEAGVEGLQQHKYYKIVYRFHPIIHPNLLQIMRCYQRSLTDLGSSIKLAETKKFTYGILSDSSPNFFMNWTKIFLPYCDGSGHQGGTDNSIRYKDT